jgi:hypothetical protein
MNKTDFNSLLGLNNDQLVDRLSQMPEFDDCKRKDKVQALIFLLPFNQLLILLDSHPSIERVDDPDDEDDDWDEHCRVCDEPLDSEGNCPSDCTEADDYGVLIGLEDGWGWSMTSPI